MRKSRFHARVFLVLLLWTSLTATCPWPAAAQAAGGSIVGIVVDTTGLPIPGASVSLTRDAQVVQSGQTDKTGQYTFADLAAGTYFVTTSANGYQSDRSDAIVVTGTDRVAATTTLLPATVVNTPREVARVTTIAGVRNGLQTTTVLHRDMESKLLQRENFVRVGDALQTLPGVNLRAQSSAVGDDLYVDIRGVGDTETGVLLDGHPVGPVGVAPSDFFNGVPTAYDFQASPLWALRNVQTVFGSGALGLYGTDAIGGVVDLQTLEPTAKPVTEFTQGIGNNGKSTSILQASGTSGKFGYVVVHGVQGTYGSFAPAIRPQTGLAGTDFTSATLAANTYSTSANYLLRSDLAKLRFGLSQSSALTLTYYDGVSWDDKSGNGDNDFLTYDQQVYNGNKVIAGGGSVATDSMGNVLWSCQPGTPGPNGNPPTAGIAVNTDNGYRCATAQQFAAGSSGPAGGGPGPWQAIRTQDYHARFTTSLGNHLLVFDAYRNNYAVDYNRSEASNAFDTEYIRTNGFLISDDLATGRNDLGFGFFGLGQQVEERQFNAAIPGIVSLPIFNFTESNFFLRDTYDLSSRTELFFNGWLKHTTVTNETKFDPRLSFVYRPTGSDVVRLTGGASTSAPTPSVRFSTSSLDQTFTNINVNCNGTTSVGAVGNPGAQSETGSDVEAAFGHRFFGDSTIQLTVYAQEIHGKLYNAEEPVSVLGAGAIPPTLLANYINRFQTLCPNYAGLTQAQLLPLMTVSTPINVGSGFFQGEELAGRVRLNPNLYADYSYDIQSAALYGIPDSILMSNLTLVPGSQIVGIPLHKGSLGIDFATHRGFEARIDTYFIGTNNAYNRGAYNYSNLSVSQALGRAATINVGVFNLFNQASDTYGRIGWGIFHGENQFGTDLNAFDQGSERFSLPPTQLQLMVTLRS